MKVKELRSIMDCFEDGDEVRVRVYNGSGAHLVDFDVWARYEPNESAQSVHVIIEPDYGDL